MEFWESEYAQQSWKWEVAKWEDLYCPILQLITKQQQDSVLLSQGQRYIYMSME